MSCMTTAAPTLFDRPFIADHPRESERSFAAVDLFDFLPDISRRIKQEIVARPEEDVERWDGQS
jgi:hypothetical protein